MNSLLHQPFIAAHSAPVYSTSVLVYQFHCWHQRFDQMWRRNTCLLSCLSPIPVLVSLLFVYLSLIFSLPALSSFNLPCSLLLSLAHRPITLDCGSKERPKHRPSDGWSWRNPSRSSWTSSAMSHCSSSGSCSMCPVFPAWSKRPRGKESPDTAHINQKRQTCQLRFRLHQRYNRWYTI